MLNYCTILIVTSQTLSYRMTVVLSLFGTGDSLLLNRKTAPWLCRWMLSQSACRPSILCRGSPDVPWIHGIQRIFNITASQEFFLAHTVKYIHPFTLMIFLLKVFLRQWDCCSVGCAEFWIYTYTSRSVKRIAGSHSKTSAYADSWEHQKPSEGIT